MKRNFNTLYPVLIILGVICYGTLGYVLIEKWSFLDSLYMTIITLTTVGYGEIHILSDAGRVFSIFLMLTGVGSMFYLLSVGARILLEGEIRDIFGRKRLNKQIESLKNHYIVCGYGRMGKIVCDELSQQNVPFVVIENKAEVLASIKPGILAIQGDATLDKVLTETGVEKAWGLISVLSSDADNMYVVLSARGLNPKLKIVVRASDEGAEKKLLRAGADNVVSPYFIGGLRIAHTLMKPAIVDSIEFATRTGNLELQMREIRISETSKLIDRKIQETGISGDPGIILVAIKRDTGELLFNPVPETEIRMNDTLIVMGMIDGLRKLEKLTGAQENNIANSSTATT